VLLRWFGDRGARVRAAGGGGVRGALERGIRQHHRGLDLALGDPPVAPEQRGLLLGRDELESVAAIERDCPLSRGPGADQEALCAQVEEVPEQLAPDSVALAPRRDVGMPDQVDVSHRLDPHHPDQLTAGLVSPERHPGRDLLVELIRRHIRLAPAVGGYHAAIRLRRRVDDL
jgi:hypothetical protein